jgi:hypothetical protein
MLLALRTELGRDPFGEEAVFEMHVNRPMNVLATKQKRLIGSACDMGGPVAVLQAVLHPRRLLDIVVHRARRLPKHSLVKLAVDRENQRNVPKYARL